MALDPGNFEVEDHGMAPAENATSELPGGMNVENAGNRKEPVPAGATDTLSPEEDTMMTPIESIPAWCCTDCIMLFANGETPLELSEDETDAWVAEIDRRTDGYHVACGGEHETGCENVEWDEDGNYVSWAPYTDCGCETQEFSWRQCETCGSTLGGARHAVTLFRR